MEPMYILLGISLIILFGFFAEFLFKKLGVPDILFLLILGFVIGPNVLHLVNPQSFAIVAPVFTTFALLFLMFDGSLSIDLRSFTNGLFSGTSIAFFNFIISSATITGILYLFKFDILIALLLGFTLGGISSAFVIPLLKQLNPKGDVYTILTLESALTDVFTIVFALTMMQLIKINVFSFKGVLVQIVSLFAVAGLIGIVSAGLWILLDKHIFKENKSFMSMIAYIILVYFITEFLGGNGAIASMFFGIILKNSKLITSIVMGIKSEDVKKRNVAMNGELGINALTENEHVFYNQISFFLKTFFFVYIGMLLNIKNPQAMIIGGALAVAILIVRNMSSLITQKLKKQDRSLINSVFARGLAAAAVIQIAVSQKIITDILLIDITYFFIVCTIILSSMRVFVYKHKFKETA